MKRLFFWAWIIGGSWACQEPTDCCGQPSVNTSIGLVGSPADVNTTTQGGTVLMGGSTDVDQAFRWMIERSGGGDFVILRASGSTGYNDYVFGLGTANSVETLLINSRDKASHPETGRRIREAEAVFIAGGDQANYVNFWAGTEVSAAIGFLINEKKVPIGGTSAGCAILSDYIFDARNGSVTSAEALANPQAATVSVSKSFVQIPFLARTVADQHYSQREREGRHVAFLARVQKDFDIPNPRGIGVDEQTAVCIDAAGHMVVMGAGSAHFLQAQGVAETCLPGVPLHWINNQQALQVNSIRGSSTGTAAFHAHEWPATGTFWFVESGVLKKTP
ncbi:MAG: cyanophycinase [Cyclobacteriaceae bacterium]|nr:cyanophycinase [Cyclobacteriaceae bacterium]